MTEAGITIGRATGDDLGILAGIERDGAQLYRAIGYDFCADGPVREPHEHARALNEGTILVARTDTGHGEAEGPVAFAMLWPCDGRAHLAELSVRLAWQNRGVGRRLLDGAEAWARTAGYPEITLTTFRDVAWNAPVYARRGYRVFVPGLERPALRAVIAEEAGAGFHVRPRVVMAKRLSVSASACDR
ncbi:GNAT family N-acetyltransferase [Oceanibacterium hippocampi]|uniref:Acetyltransferase (GNAT) family protein n=1 Tax=Oceanibacterium hippocampi TaxID=745714 RepID=A0A1Y5SML7_9PROT|nr:GNAT family N-acetyltransferase [Oceanibacterium hippocampi]SLN43627.1 Acetyltransferase (GNAT) family protein [Oceanibacterium hippocampi]